MKIILNDIDKLEKSQTEYFNEKIKEWKADNKLCKLFFLIGIPVMLAIGCYLMSSLICLSFIAHENLQVSLVGLVLGLFFGTLFYITDAKLDTSIYENNLNKLHNFCEILRKHFSGEICIYESNGYKYNYYETNDIKKEIKSINSPIELKKSNLPRYLNQEYKLEKTINFDELCIYINDDKDENMEPVTFVSE